MPGDPAWIENARPVQELLELLTALAAVAEDPDAYVLHHVPYQVAAETIGDIRADLPDRPSGRGLGVYLLALPGFRLDALWQVLAVLRRAQDRDPDADRILAFAEDYGGHAFHPPRKVGDFIADLERVLAVLTLDIPAVASVATTLILSRERDADFASACAQLHAAWKAAGAVA